MNHFERLTALERLKEVKERDFDETYSKFRSRDQQLITFEEISKMKEEIHEISILITAYKKVHNL